MLHSPRYFLLIWYWPIAFSSVPRRVRPISLLSMCRCRMLQRKLDQPISGPSSPRNSQAMVVDGSSSEVADNLVRSIQALKAEVSRLHGLLRASQVERMYTSQFILNTWLLPSCDKLQACHWILDTIRHILLALNNQLKNLPVTVVLRTFLYIGSGHGGGSRDLSVGLETSRDLYVKVLVLVFWLCFFGHKISVSKWRWTFVGHGRHKALFTNLCYVLIVESLNGDHWPVIFLSLLLGRHCHGCTSLYCVSNDFFSNQSVMELCFWFLDFGVLILELKVLVLVESWQQVWPTYLTSCT